LYWSSGRRHFGFIICGLHPFLNEPISPSETALPLVERASIAVLPFNNLSGDPEQEYFSDGITNDLITAFSKFKELLVIASNTIFTYKGKAVNIERIGQTYQVQVSFGWTEFPNQVLQQAKDLALKSLSLEESNAGAYTLLGLIYTFHVF
jgi:hypothetical protein